jgi:ABC-type lipoprotein release transport system permease subunit
VGVDLDRYDRIVSLRSKVVDGTARLEPGEGIIGRELADDLGVRVGDRVGIVTGGVSDSLRVTALVDLGVRELNRRTVIVPLRTAQSLVGLPGGATSLDLTLVDIWSAQTLADELAARWPYKAESWQQANAQLVSALNAQSVSTAVIRGVVMVVVVLGIASVLVVSVVQKRREIGILRAMGATQGQVLRIFLLQGAIVGALGSALGVLLAVLLIWAFTPSCSAPTACRCSTSRWSRRWRCAWPPSPRCAACSPRWRRRGAPPARPGAGDPPVSAPAVAPPPCCSSSTACARATTSACRTRPRCCTACRCASAAASSWP